MKRIIRERLLTDEEAEKDQAIRKQITAELPEIIARHRERLEAPSSGRSAGDGSAARQD